MNYQYGGSLHSDISAAAFLYECHFSARILMTFCPRGAWVYAVALQCPRVSVSVVIFCSGA